jgi:hypothetical protein
MTSHIAGIDDALARIREGPCTLRELQTFLNETLGTAWITSAQARWRADWLESFAKTKRSGELIRAL